MRKWIHILPVCGLVLLGTRFARAQEGVEPIPADAAVGASGGTHGIVTYAGPTPPELPRFTREA